MFEARLSPQLHSRLYGFTQHDFLQTVRGDYTYRPMVFMQHGLAVAMFLGMATVVGVHAVVERHGRAVCCRNASPCTTGF